MHKLMIGLRFGKLLVVELEHRRLRKNGGTLLYYKCHCDCGKDCVVNGRKLRRGHTRSCGCYRLARITKHGGAREGNLHPLYRLWNGMISRCDNERRYGYKYYGGRGITVDPCWRDFRNFVEDMMPTWQKGLSLERKDNDGPYSKDNCKWATMREQHQNKRNNVWLTFQGKRLNVAGWACELGMDSNTLYERLKSGWCVEKALTTPVRPRRKSAT